MRGRLTAFIREASGVTAVEYGLVIALVGIAVILLLEGIGVSLNSVFTQVEAALAG